VGPFVINGGNPMAEETTCGHSEYASGKCAEISCSNYYMKGDTFWEGVTL
jgi:hypothetical protein